MIKLEAEGTVHLKIQEKEYMKGQKNVLPFHRTDLSLLNLGKD